jgi:hypothetical protein
MSSLLTTKRVRVWPLGFLGLVFLLGMGCRGTGSVKGKVSKGDQPIRFGRVVFFVGTEHQTAVIQSDGTYEAVGVPVGEADIVVVSPQPSNPMGIKASDFDGGMLEKMPKEQREMMEARKKQYEKDLEQYVKIPRRYTQQESTPLKYEVKKGENEFDIKMED